MALEEPPDLPDNLSPIGSIPGESSQPTPEEMQIISNRKSAMEQKLNGFIDLDELEKLSFEEKIKLVQNVCRRFVFGHLSGMNGTIGNSDTLNPKLTDRKIVTAYKEIATHLWGQDVKRPYSMSEEDIETLKHLATTDKKGNTHYFESIIRPPNEEPIADNPYTSTDMAYHDARILDHLISELYLNEPSPASPVVGFSKN